MTSLLRDIVFNSKEKTIMLIESLGTKELLLEITIPELKKQWVDSGRITEKQFADVEEALGELGAAYIAWFLARSVTDKTVDFDDLDIWASRLKVFKNNNKLMSIKDLGQVKTSSDLEKIANDIGDVRLKNYAKAERVAMGASRSGVSTNKLVQDCFLGKCDTSKGSFDVYKIPAHNSKLYAVDRVLGKGANWCTASAPGYFRNYNDAPLYVFIGKGDEKYQMSIQHNEFKDKTDVEVDYTQKWVKEMYDWLIGIDSEAKYSNNLQRVIDSEERLKVEYPEALKKVEEILEGKNLKDTFSVVFQQLRDYSETFFRVFCEKLDLPLHVATGIRRMRSVFTGNDTGCCFVYVKGGYALTCSLHSTRYGSDDNPLNELVDRNIAAVLRQDGEILEREIYPHVDRDVKEKIVNQLEGLFDPQAPSIVDFKPELLDGTKFQILDIKKPSNKSTYEYFRKIYFELTNNNLDEYHSERNCMTVVFLSDNAYFAVWSDDFYKGKVGTASFERFVKTAVNRRMAKNTGSAIWERPVEFYYSLWKPFIQHFGLNPVFKDIEAIKKYGHKGELIASRYSLPLPKILDKVDFAYRVPSNRLDLPELFGAPKASEKGVLFRLPQTWANNAEGEYFVRARDGFVFRSRGGEWGYVRERAAYKVADLIMKTYILNGGDEDVLQVPYNEAFLKTPKQREREAERQRQREERAANREARRAERVANREARRAERAAARAERPVRVRQPRQVAEPGNTEPQQVQQPQQQPANQQEGITRNVRWSRSRVDTIVNSVRLTWEQVIEQLRTAIENNRALSRRLNISDIISAKEEGMTTVAYKSQTTGAFYIYYLQDGHARKRFSTTSPGNGMIVLNAVNYHNGTIDENRFKVTVLPQRKGGTYLLESLLLR